MIELDYETYSEAGYKWIDGKPVSIKSGKPGIKGVGAAVYAAHPTTEVLCAAYDLHDGAGRHVWLPGMAPPTALFAAIAAGETVEAHYSGFEFFIWNLVCVRLYAWPWLNQPTLRCSQSKALAYGLPAALDKIALVLGTAEQKDKEGTRLINKFCKPRKPTKDNPNRRILPTDDPLDFDNLIRYCLQDIATEADISARIPDLSPVELKVWQTDQVINQRGVHVDREGIEACIVIVEQAAAKYTAELQQLTGGAVGSVSELDKFKAWLRANGCLTTSLDKDRIVSLLESDTLAPHVRRSLEIRQVLGSASVTKLYAFQRYIMADDRIRDTLGYHIAHTGRWGGSGPQFHNFPRAFTPDVAHALEVIKGGNLEVVEAEFGDPLDIIAACLRGLITPAPGADFLSSDYSAIEAVIIAFMAGEQWRIDVFNTHGKIYEKSISMVTDVSFEEILAHKERTGEHHPLRSKGKIVELASGFQGSVGAWKQWGAEKYYADDAAIQADVNKWRAASPKIVDFWYGLQNTVQDAIQYPGREFKRFGLTFRMYGEALGITLLSGRILYYHGARISPYGKYGDEIIYKGKVKGQWVDIPTYGGKLAENIVQAIAREILAHALVNLEAAGYPVVLHVHDEVLAEVATGTGSIEGLESIMNALPAWCADWPVKATGGWRGDRFKKD